MQIRPDALDVELKKRLPAVCLIASSEPLLLLEAAAKVRAVARAQGFVEREAFDIGVGVDFNDFRHASQSSGLFAQQRILEIRLIAAKVDPAGVEILRDYLQSPDPHAVLMVLVPELSGAVANLSWFKLCDSHGWTVSIWPPRAHEVPAWLRRRAQQLGLRLTSAAVDALSERVEGNLLAARQELEMLALLAGGADLDVDAVNALVADAARFDVFKLAEAVLLGEPLRAARILRSMRAEGDEPVPAFSWLCNQVEQTALMAEQVALGTPISLACAQAGIKEWNKQPFIKALQRGDARSWELRLCEAADLDRVLKGRGDGAPWLELERWALRCADPAAAGT